MSVQSTNARVGIRLAPERGAAKGRYTRDADLGLPPALSLVSGVWLPSLTVIP